MSKHNLSFASLMNNGYDAQTLRLVAQLVFESFHDFYLYLPLEREVVLDVIAQQMLDPKTECFDPFLLKQGDTIVGIICSFPASELAERQRTSTVDFIRLLDRAGRAAFKQAMIEGNHSAAALPDTEGLYVSRVAIAANCKGQGLGGVFLDEFIARFPGSRIQLHVDQSNLIAQKMYLSRGFSLIQQSEHRKIVMFREG